MRVQPKVIKKRIQAILDKYRFSRAVRGVRRDNQTAKVDIGLKMHDYLYTFTLQDGCHWGFSTGNHVQDSDLSEYLKYLEMRILQYAIAAKIEYIEVEKTWELGLLLYD